MSGSRPRLLAAGCAVAVLAACGAGTGDGAASTPASSSPLPEPSPTASVASACTQVMAALPTTVAGQSRTSRQAFSATWGTPPVTLRCGVARPKALAADSTCNEVNGVGWFAEQVATGYTFTTIGRRGYVEVRVPSSVQPAADALVDLSAAVKKMPVVTPCQ